MPARLDQINIVSKDLDATVAFYRRLGIGMQDPFRTRSGEPFHTNSASGVTPLLEADSSRFARIWNTGWRTETDLDGRIVIGLRFDSRDEVDRVYSEMVDSGHRSLQPPYDAFWGARYAVIEDPDGIAVGLMSPADNAHRSPPPID